MAVTCTVKIEDDVLVEDADGRVHLYRIAQEAVSNAVRHGGAHHVALSLTTLMPRPRA